MLFSLKKLFKNIIFKNYQSFSVPEIDIPKLPFFKYYESIYAVCAYKK